jgi:hypothetical protein
MALAFEILTAAGLLAGSGASWNPACGMPAGPARIGHPGPVSCPAAAFLAPDPSAG